MKNNYKLLSALITDFYAHNFLPYGTSKEFVDPALATSKLDVVSDT